MESDNLNQEQQEDYKSSANFPSDDKKDPQEQNRKKKKKKKGLKYWPLKVFFLALFLSLAFSLISEMIINTESIIVSVLVLIILISLNIFFDIIGIAFASCDIAPFTSMSSRKVKGAKMCLYLLQHAEVVTNVCADVIGDICGIVCGAAGAGIVAVMLITFSTIGDNLKVLLTILVSCFIAAVTVSGKAAAKKYGIRNAQAIVFACGRFFSLFTRDKKKTKDKQDKKSSDDDNKKS